MTAHRLWLAPWAKKLSEGLRGWPPLRNPRRARSIAAATWILGGYVGGVYSDWNGPMCGYRSAARTDRIWRR